MNTKHVKLATFATSMRAASLVEDLATAGINAIWTQPKWTNKRLPPPRIEVLIGPNDVAQATAFLETWGKA